MRTRIAALAVASALIAFAVITPGLRRRFIQDIITWDAPPGDPVPLPAGTGTGPGLSTADRVRVVLIDGLSAATAAKLPTWTSLCKRGLQLTVDVGFPTVSLPVEVSLWTGLTQQQTGVMFRSDRPLVPPLDQRGLPARIPRSHAVAESHGYIVRSLGFAVTEPEAGDVVARDRDAEIWPQTWQPRALAAVASDTRLAFVHILRVDTWGHRKGHDSTEYASAAAESDAILAQLHAAAPDARWFLLSDHGHLPRGGHGGEDREVRQVQHCIVGPGVAPGSGGVLHLVDMSRAIADSLGVPLDPRSPARPLSVALQHPLSNDDAIPPLPLGRGALAVLILALGLSAVGWSVRRWWIAPWWFVVACVLLLALRGVPTMSMPMVYGKESFTALFDLDRLLRLLQFEEKALVMTRSWLLALPLALAATWIGLSRTTLLRVVVAQLALPVAALAAALTACGGWSALFGAEVSPMTPRYTAFTLALLLMVAHGAGAVGLAVLARTARQAFYRRRSAETKQSAP